MTSIEPYRNNQHPVRIDRNTNKAMSRAEKEHMLAAYNEQFERLGIAIRLEGGALLTGELNNWMTAMAVQQHIAAAVHPDAGVRVGFALDQLAKQGSNIIGQYMGVK